MRAWVRAAALAVGAMGCTASLDGNESIGDVEQEAVVCADGPTTPGIDVSYYQGSPDWKKVEASGQRFAITRINDGGFLDPKFDANYKAIRDVGMVRGSYQFFRSSKDPIEQANLVLKKIGKLGPGDIAPVLDVELTDGAGAAEMAGDIGKWVDHVEKAIGRKPIIYTGKYFWNDNVKTSALKDHPLWHAQYTSAKCPDIASPWKRWEIWQYSSSGSVPGISGNVDMNRLNGNELDLQDLAANGYRASIESIDYPKKMAAGSTGTVVIKLKNEGARTWGEKTRLGTSEKRDRKSAFRAPSWLSEKRVLGIEGNVKSGQKATLQFNIVAPAQAGKHVEHFNLVEEGVAWFSDIVPGGGPKDDAIALSIEVTPADPNGPPPNGTGGGGGSEPTGGGGAGGADPIAPPAADPGAPSSTGSCAMTSAPRDGSIAAGGFALAAFLAARRRRRR